MKQASSLLVRAVSRARTKGQGCPVNGQTRCLAHIFRQAPGDFCVRKDFPNKRNIVFYPECRLLSFVVSVAGFVAPFRMQRTEYIPVKSGKRFANGYPHQAHGVLGVLRWQLGLGPKEDTFGPPGKVEPYRPEFSQPGQLSQPVDGCIQLSWIGHSTFLIQHRGRNILTDPIFGNCHPMLPLARLRRCAPPGIPFAALPEIHDVLISHNHYDHLDDRTVRLLGDAPHYWLPSGLAHWFYRRNLRHCREMAWWQSASLGGDMEIHCVPAQHFSGRHLFDRDRTHWCGWVLRSPQRSVYFAGDTGYCPVFREIGRRFGGFDLALIPIGAYRPRWLMQPIHVDPREAVQIHQDVRSRRSVACHWGTFRLTDEPQNEPPTMLRQVLADRGLSPGCFHTLQPGQTITV